MWSSQTSIEDGLKDFVAVNAAASISRIMQKQ
jgi:hypothetical protein